MSNNRIVYTPRETAMFGVQYLRQITNNLDRLVPFPVPGMRRYVPPLMPAELCTILAQTSHYKTGTITAWEYDLARHLAETGRGDDAIIHVDTETPLEILAATAIMTEERLSYYDLVSGGKRVDPDRFIAAADRSAGAPIFPIATRVLGTGQEITLTNVSNAIGMVERGEVDGKPHRIAAIFIDYLQTLRFDPQIKLLFNDNQRRLQVASYLDYCRQMGARFSCPTIVGVQAKQDLEHPYSHTTKEQLGLYIPSEYDAFETSFIAQRSDRMIAAWLPHRTYKNKPTLQVGHWSVRITDELLFYWVLKQHWRLPSRGLFAYELDYYDPDNEFTLLYTDVDERFQEGHQSRQDAPRTHAAPQKGQPYQNGANGHSSGVYAPQLSF